MTALGQRQEVAEKSGLRDIGTSGCNPNGSGVSSCSAGRRPEDDPKVKEDKAAKDEPATLTLQDLRKIEPPGGVPLVGASGRGNRGGRDPRRRPNVWSPHPLEDLDQWVAGLERIMAQKLETDLEKQGCRTFIVVHMTEAFDDLQWNAKKAVPLFKRVQTMSMSEAKAWKDVCTPDEKRDVEDQANLCHSPRPVSG